MYNFDYTRPLTVTSAVEALRQEDSQALAGGQSLLPTLKQRLGAPSTLVDLKAIPSLQGIIVNDSISTIAAATTHQAVADNAEIQRFIPSLAALAGGIGDPQIRNRGTIGGSLANNDPSACYPAAVLALGATIITNAREISADDYFQGMFATALDDGEIITAVRFPAPERSAYCKFSQPASRFALTGVYVARDADGRVRVAITGAAEDGVFRHGGLEAALSENFATDAVDKVAVASDGMMSDLHGSPAYRAHLVKILCGRAVTASLSA